MHAPHCTCSECTSRKSSTLGGGPGLAFEVNDAPPRLGDTVEVNSRDDAFSIGDVSGAFGKAGEVAAVAGALGHVINALIALFRSHSVTEALDHEAQFTIITELQMMNLGVQRVMDAFVPPPPGERTVPQLNLDMTIENAAAVASGK